VTDERVVGDAADGVQQRNYTHGVFVVALEPVVADLTTTRPYNSAQCPTPPSTNFHSVTRTDVSVGAVL